MVKLYLLPIFTLLLFQWSIAQTFTGTGGLIPDDGTIIAYDLPVIGLPTNLDTTNFGLVNVCINLTHTWNADLALSLRSPDGTIIPLFSNIGGDTDGFINTCFSGNEMQSIYGGVYPYTGSFRPFGDMGAINNGQNPNGTWQLVILDTYAFADAGELFDWSITFGSNPCKPFPFASSDLPILLITTGGQTIIDDPKIEAQLRLIDNGPGQRNFVLQTTAAYEGPIGIELHGNSAQGFPKKSYNLETRDTAGQDRDTSLLGLSKASDFILTANFSDKTLMRNALTYDLARRTGEYAT
ncbi:MAG: CotH kinase family protein, partial [Saprospiraceae bacterium]